MPIGKDSITKRVAKTATEEKNIAPELVATTAAAPKTPAKKSSSTTAKKPAASTAKKPAAKKPAAPKKETAPVTEKKVDTAVLANVSPETVAAVIGHKENTGFEKVQVGEKMPVHLL